MGGTRLPNRFFGYTSGGLPGQSLDLIIPELLADAHWAGFNRAMESGKTHWPDTPR